MLQYVDLTLVVCVVLIRELLERRHSPLFVNDELVAVVIGKLDVEVGEVDIFEKALFGMFIITIARITDKWFILIVR